MTAERPSESLRLEQVCGMHYIAEDMAQAEDIACAAVNYMFPAASRPYVPADFQFDHIDPTSDYVSKRYFRDGNYYTRYLETNFTQRDGAGPVKLALGNRNFFYARDRSVITESIEEQTGIDRQPQMRDLRRKFGDVEDFNKYIQTDASPVSGDFLDSAARRRVYHRLWELFSSRPANVRTNQLDRYMQASEEERVELLQKLVHKARKKQNSWQQAAIPFGYKEPQELVHNRTLDLDVAWGGIPDEDVAVGGMVVSGGYYDLQTHRFRPERMNRFCYPEVIAWISPKRPGPDTTEKAFGARLDEVAYDLGSTATGAFKKVYAKQYLHPKPKNICARPQKKPLRVKAHQVYREIRGSSASPQKVFFGSN